MDYSSIKLDKEKSEDLYGQLYRELQRLIMLLPHHSEEELLSERQLCELLKLARPTVHQAYAMLEAIGIVRRKPDKSLHVVPNARYLLRSPYPMIGVLINDNSLLQFVDKNGNLPLYFMSGIHDRAAELEYSIALLHLPGARASHEEVRNYLENVVNRMSGVIHLGNRDIENDKPLEQLLRFPSVAQVFISGYSDIPGIGSVQASFKTGIRELCNEMKKKDMGTVGLLLENKCPDISKYHFIQESWERPVKIRGFFQKNGIEILPEACGICPDNDRLLAFLSSLKEMGKFPHVFFCQGNIQAQNVCICLKKLGLKVPQDISVVGHSINADTENTHSIASISFPYHVMGRAAVSMLNDFYVNGVNEDNSSLFFDTHFLPQKTFRGY